jgi:hypothetical protein
MSRIYRLDGKGPFTTFDVVRQRCANYSKLNITKEVHPNSDKLLLQAITTRTIVPKLN